MVKIDEDEEKVTFTITVPDAWLLIHPGAVVFDSPKEEGKHRALINSEKTDGESQVDYSAIPDHFYSKIGEVDREFVADFLNDPSLVMRWGLFSGVRLKVTNPAIDVLARGFNVEQ